MSNALYKNRRSTGHMVLTIFVIAILHHRSALHRLLEHDFSRIEPRDSDGDHSFRGAGGQRPRHLHLRRDRDHGERRQHLRLRADRIHAQ